MGLIRQNQLPPFPREGWVLSIEQSLHAEYLEGLVALFMLLLPVGKTVEGPILCVVCEILPCPSPVAAVFLPHWAGHLFQVM